MEAKAAMGELVKIAATKAKEALLLARAGAGGPRHQAPALALAPAPAPAPTLAPAPAPALAPAPAPGPGPGPDVRVPFEYDRDYEAAGDGPTTDSLSLLAAAACDAPTLPRAVEAPELYSILNCLLDKKLLQSLKDRVGVARWKNGTSSVPILEELLGILSPPSLIKDKRKRMGRRELLSACFDVGSQMEMESAVDQGTISKGTKRAAEGDKQSEKEKGGPSRKKIRGESGGFEESPGRKVFEASKQLLHKLDKKRDALEEDEDLCDEEEGEGGEGKRRQSKRMRRPSRKASALPLKNLSRRDPFEEQEDHEDHDNSLDDDDE